MEIIFALNKVSPRSLSIYILYRAQNVRYSRVWQNGEVWGGGGSKIVTSAGLETLPHPIPLSRHLANYTPILLLPSKVLMGCRVALRSIAHAQL
jgi:hypothetical protein